MPDPAPPFEIIDQTHEETPSTDGQMVSDWRIDFVTPSGVRSFVRIPDEMYNAQYIHSEIAAKAAEIEKVQAGPHA